MEINEDQLKVYEGIRNIEMKSRVTNCILVAFFLILIYIFFFAKTLVDKIVFGALDTILVGTMYPMVKHFFPAFKNAKAAEKRSGKKSETTAPKKTHTQM